MISRRELLTRTFGAVVAAAVAPLIDLTDTTPAFWNQAPLRKLMPWRITFPDGTSYHFKGEVIAEKILDNGNVDLTVRPSGSVMISQEISYPLNFIDEPPSGRGPETVPSPDAPRTVLEINDSARVELKEITMPSLTSVDRDNFGLKRTGEFTMTIQEWKEHEGGR